jgi:hypothetical protein
MKRLSVSGVLGMVGSAFLLTGACGGSSFTSADGSGGLAGSAGVGRSGGASSGGSQSSAGEGGATSESGAGGQMSAAGAGGRRGGAGSGGSMSVAGSGGSIGSAGSGGSMSSAGASGSGGVVGSAGSSGAVGVSGSAGSGGNSCVTGTVTFKMVPAAGSVTSAFCSQGCTGNWLTVTDSNSKTVVLDRGCGSADCSTCTKSLCPPIACISQVIPIDGLSRAWDETQWNPSVCGAAITCSADQCVPAGKYKAKMCAVKNTMPQGSFCSPSDTAICTDVDFVLPGATTVQGTISG